MKFPRLLRFELAKLVRMRLTRVLLLLIAGETIVKAGATYYAQEYLNSGILRGSVPSGAAFLSALSVLSLNAVAIVSLIFASLLLSAETSSGALRYLCTLPFSRTAILSAKFLVLALFVATCLAIVAGINLACAWGFYGIGPIEEYDFVVYSAGEIIGYHFLVHAFAFLPILAVATFGMLVSAWCASSGAAVAITILLYSIMTTVESIVDVSMMHFREMRYEPAVIFDNLIKGVEMNAFAEMAPSLGYAAGHLAFFLVATVLSFVPRDNYS